MPHLPENKGVRQLVVAADGIGSKADKLVGGEVRARSSGRAMCRAVTPVLCLAADLEVKEAYSLKDGVDPIVRTYFGQVLSLRIALFAHSIYG